MIGARPLSSSSNSSPFDTTIRNSIGGGSGGRISFSSSSNSNSSSSNNNNRTLIDDENDEEFNQKLSSSTPLENHTISKFSKTSSSWFNPVTTIQSLINYSLFLVVVSQLICPVLLPLVLSSFLEKQQPDGNGAVDHFVVSFSVGFENDKRLVTNVNLSATKMIYLLQWLIHIPLVILPYISLIVNKSYVRESRMMVYWFCILSLFLSNVVVSLKQASFDWISFIPSILDSTDISWGGEKLVFNRSIPFIKKQLETSSILPQLLSLLLFTTITLYFIRDVIFGLNVNFRGRDEIVGLREFIEREFSTCLVSPLQAMLKLTSIDSNLESINHTTIIPQQPIVSQKEVTQNVPSNKDMQSPSSPTEVNVTPSVETNESPRLALSIYNTTAKQPMTVKKTVILDKQNKDKEESDDSDWGVDSDDDEEIKKNTKFSHLAEAKEKMITKSDKKTENEASHSPSPSSDLPSVSMVITNSVHTAESKPHSILHSNTSPTTGTTVTTGAPKVIGGNFMKKRFSGRSTPETGCDEYQSSLQAVYNKNRNSKLITEPLDLEESKESNSEVEKPKTSEERRKVSFDD